MDKDARFSREFRRAREEFCKENIEHGAEFFEKTKYDGTGKIVFKESQVSSVKILDYIESRENLRISGGGKINGVDVTVAKVF